MRGLRLFFFCLAVLGVSCVAKAESDTETDRGFVSVDFTLGYQESRLMSSDGSLANYKGYLGGASIDIKVWGNNSGEVRLFGSYLSGRGTGDPSDNVLKRTETLLGAKIFANNWIYLAVGTGHEATVASSSATGDFNMDASIAALGAGVEFPMSGSWFWSVGTWYKSGPIKKSDNGSYVGNSFFDGADLQFSLIWSPPSTIINITGKH